MNDLVRGRTSGFHRRAARAGMAVCVLIVLIAGAGVGGCSRIRCPEGTKLTRGQSPDTLVSRIGAPTAVREERDTGESRLYLFGGAPAAGEAWPSDTTRVSYMYPFRGYQVVFEKGKARECDCVVDEDRQAIRGMIEGRSTP